jgi:hypothetical protein
MLHCVSLVNHPVNPITGIHDYHVSLKLEYVVNPGVVVDNEVADLDVSQSELVTQAESRRAWSEGIGVWCFDERLPLPEIVALADFRNAFSLESLRARLVLVGDGWEPLRVLSPARANAKHFPDLKNTPILPSDKLEDCRVHLNVLDAAKEDVPADCPNRVLARRDTHYESNSAPPRTGLLGFPMIGRVGPLSMAIDIAFEMA